MQQPQQNNKNIIIFVVAMMLSLGVWYALKTYVFPPPPEPPPEQPSPETRVEIKPTPEVAAAAVGAGQGGLDQALWQSAFLSLAESKPEAKPVEAPPPLPTIAEKPPTPPSKYLRLGDMSRTSKFHLYVELDPRGASVERVVLNKFQQANALGRPVKMPDGSPKPMELIPPDPENPSNVLLAYNVADKTDDKPLDTLGRVDWSGGADPKQEPTVREETLDDGRVRQSVTFVSPPNQGFQITKTYSLTQGDYDVALEVKVKRLKTATLDDKPVAFRYQLCAAHGLPIEGQWYTYIFRNSLIGQTEKSKSLYRGVVRDMQDLRQVSNWEGGTQILKKENYIIRYAGVAVQYFASAVVVDTRQDKQDFLASARPTLEKAVTKGVVKSISPTLDSFVLTRADGTNQDFYIRKGEEEKFLGLHEGLKCAVVHTTGAYRDSLNNGKGGYPEYAHKLQADSEAQPLWEDDVTVRVTTEPIELKPGEEATHKYLLYNGPVKVMLLSQPDVAAEAVPPPVVSHYMDDLNLNTLTDYQTNGFIGNITSFLYITPLLIRITNVMHWVLWFLHAYLFIPYIVCIICLTLAVRGAMFPVSRKQAITSLRMQQLAPELKKLHEKFKDDKQGMAGAQMELYRKHGVNPFGTCWLLALQMPIFMGLYYALQESIHFRLAGVSSLWMPNLSAPDMMIYWTNSIPFISTPDSYGWFIYLGPYLNILPIVAVSLMLVQQKWTMPPPTDEQQEQQQKMMKYMMIFMGLMFYKVASGLCIYFIASSMWGFCERMLLPKRKPGAPVPTTADDKARGGLLTKLLNLGGAAPRPSRRGRRRAYRPNRTMDLRECFPASRAAARANAARAGAVRTGRAASPTASPPATAP